MLHAWLGILNTNKKPSQDYLLQGLSDSKSCGPVRLGGEPATLSVSIPQKNPRLSWVFSYCSGVGRDPCLTAGRDPCDNSLFHPKKQKTPSALGEQGFCGVGRDRTGDTRIFSPLLYRLSYRTIPLKADANIRTYPVCSEFIHRFFGIFGCLLFPLFNFTFPSP